MQERIKEFWSTFLVAFVVSVFIFILLFMDLCKFGVFPYKTVLYIPCILSGVIATVYAISMCVCLEPSKRYLINKWMRKYYNRLVILYILLCLFLVAIKSEVVWSFTEIHNLISLEWTIFGISTAIFLIWSALSVNYLNNKKPMKVTCNSIQEELKCIYDKAYFLENTSSLFINIKIMAINLACLIATTTFLYILEKVTIVNQTMALFTLLLCTNTISGLFFDILKPFNENKKALIKEVQITEYEEALIAMMIITDYYSDKSISKEGEQKVIDAVLEWNRKRREKEEKEEMEKQDVHKE